MVAQPPTRSASKPPLLTIPLTILIRRRKQPKLYDHDHLRCAFGRACNLHRPNGHNHQQQFDTFLRPVETDKNSRGRRHNRLDEKVFLPAALKPITSGVATNYTDTVMNDGVGGFTIEPTLMDSGRTVQSRTRVKMEITGWCQPPMMGAARPS